MSAGHREPRPAAVALGPDQRQRGHGRVAAPGPAGGFLAAALPRRAVAGWAGRPGRDRGVPGGRSAGADRRAAVSASPAAGGPDLARRAALAGGRGRRPAWYLDRRGEQRAAACPRPASAGGPGKGRDARARRRRPARAARPVRRRLRERRRRRPDGVAARGRGAGDAAAAGLVRWPGPGGTVHGCPGSHRARRLHDDSHRRQRPARVRGLHARKRWRAPRARDTGPHDQRGTHRPDRVVQRRRAVPRVRNAGCAARDRGHDAGAWLMPRTDPAQWPGLLEPAIGYALAAVQAVTPDLLPHPTPCRGWNVGMLLRHATESLTALQEGIDAGRIGLSPAPDDPAGEPAQLFRDRASRFLSVWAGVVRTGAVRTDAARSDAARTDAARSDAAGTGTGCAESAQAETAGTECAQAGAGDWAEIIAIADRRLTLGVMTGVGAFELAVHGWDLSRACGRCQPI